MLGAPARPQQRHQTRDPRDQATNQPRCELYLLGNGHLELLLTDGILVISAVYRNGLGAFHSWRPVLMSSHFSVATKLRIIHSVVRPVLEYGMEVWGPSCMGNFPLGAFHSWRPADGGLRSQVTAAGVAGADLVSCIGGRLGKGKFPMHDGPHTFMPYSRTGRMTE
jgi:hypothetical protein